MPNFASRNRVLIAWLLPALVLSLILATLWYADPRVARLWLNSARLALAACLILVTTPYLVVWYLGWAVPLAGADDDDRLARACTLVLCAYLLPQTIPL